MSVDEAKWRIAFFILKIIILNVVVILAFGWNAYTGIGIGISFVVVLYNIIVYQTLA